MTLRRAAPDMALSDASEGEPLQAVCPHQRALPELEVDMMSRLVYEPAAYRDPSAIHQRALPTSASAEERVTGLAGGRA